MKPLDDADFRARRYLFEKKDFALAEGEYAGPTNLIDKSTWTSIVALPDDVSIRTSDKYGSQLEKIWDYWGMWVWLVRGIQSLTTNPEELPTAIAACDATDEFQAATYAALVGFYRLAFSALRNVLEQVTIAVQLTLSNDAKSFRDWRDGEERIRFGWAADMLSTDPAVVILERYLKAETNDSLFAQAPKGLVRRCFVETSKYTHGVAGFTDGDSRQSNGPIFLPKTFLQWCVAALKTYAIVLHQIKLAHPALNDVLDEIDPTGPPLSINEFRRCIIADIPTNDPELVVLKSLAAFWP
jgi:hypothetical protein